MSPSREKKTKREKKEIRTPVLCNPRIPAIQPQAIITIRRDLISACVQRELSFRKRKTSRRRRILPFRCA